MGLEREDLISDKEKEMVAYHEAGHALVAKLIPGADPLEKVTIIPRGRSLGATEQTPEKNLHNSQEISDRSAGHHAGRQSRRKDHVQRHHHRGGDDLKKASQLARRMICQWGMSEAIGPVVFKKGETHPFLGRELAEDKDYSEHTAQVIDQEIKKITLDMEKKAHAMLQKHRDLLDALAGALLAHETLSREDIDEVLNDAGLAN